MMMIDPRFRTFSGRDINLVHPRHADIDFGDVAHHIAQIRRYHGGCRRPYSVAEHLLLGLKLVHHSARVEWLLHDAHEFITQDIATPTKDALPLVMAEEMGPGIPLADVEKLQQAQRAAFRAFEERHMEAVHLAAGVRWPLHSAIQTEVKRVDRLMLVTEWAYLRDDPLPEEYRTAGVEPVRDLIPAAEMGFFVGKTQFKNACRELLPCFQKVAA